MVLLVETYSETPKSWKTGAQRDVLSPGTATGPRQWESWILSRFWKVFEHAQGLLPGYSQQNCCQSSDWKNAISNPRIPSCLSINYIASKKALRIERISPRAAVATWPDTLCCFDARTWTDKRILLFFFLLTFTMRHTLNSDTSPQHIQSASTRPLNGEKKKSPSAVRCLMNKGYARFLVIRSATISAVALFTTVISRVSIIRSRMKW